MMTEPLTPHLHEPLARRRPWMYLSIVLADLGGLGYCAAKVDSDPGDWYAAVLFIIGFLCTVGLVLWLADLKVNVTWLHRWSEEGVFVNGAWFVALAVLVWERDWGATGWGLGLVLLAAATATWGLWVDLRAERQFGLKGVRR